MTVDEQDPVQRMGDEVTGLWRQVGELVRGQSRMDGRLDRIESDVTVLKTDVAELKVGLAGTNQRLDRLELSTERRFNRIDAQLERLIALVRRSETQGC